MAESLLKTSSHKHDKKAVAALVQNNPDDNLQLAKMF